MDPIIKPPLSQEQVDVLTTMARVRAENSIKAARLIFVEEMTQTEAAKKIGCSPQLVHNTITRYLEALALVNEFLYTSLEADNNKK